MEHSVTVDWKFIHAHILIFTIIKSNNQGRRCSEMAVCLLFSYSIQLYPKDLLCILKLHTPRVKAKAAVRWFAKLSTLRVSFVDWGFFCLLRKKIASSTLNVITLFRDDPQCPHSQICILDVNGDCVNPSISEEHALGTSIQDSVMPFNWQSKFVTGKASILNPQTIFVSLASHQQAKDTKVIKVSIGGGIWNAYDLIHVTCWEIAVVYENMVLFLDQ